MSTTTVNVDHNEGERLGDWLNHNATAWSSNEDLRRQLSVVQTEFHQRLFPMPSEGHFQSVRVVGQANGLPIYSILIHGQVEMRFKCNYEEWVISVCCDLGYSVHDTFDDLFDQDYQVTAEEASGFGEHWLLEPYVTNRQAFTVKLHDFSDIHVFLFALGTSLDLRFPYAT